MPTKAAALHKTVFIFLFGIQSIMLWTQTIPRLEWASYHGGGNEDSFRDMAIDNAGNIYVVGSSRSTTSIASAGSYQPVLAGGSDVFLAKYNSDGMVIWSTYFGGSADDFGQSIDLDQAGNIFITGLTFSNNGIATAGVHQTINRGGGDVFLAKFDNSGSRIWGSYFGGSGFDFANDIEVDVGGNPVFTGWTNSSSGISSPGAFQSSYGGQDDVILAQFNTNGQMQWATYYGDIGFDTGLQVESDGSGAIYMSGWTSSLINIVSPGAYQTVYGGNTADVFLAKFTTSGSRVWSSYFGGTGNDYADALFVTAAGDIYLSGSSNSPNKISTAGSFQPVISLGYDAFLSRFTTTGSLLWSTYFGGNNDDTAYRLREGPDGAIYMGGHSKATDQIATTNAHQTVHAGGYDGFIARFEKTGERTWSTYYGGSGDDFCYGLVVDKLHRVYMAGYTDGSNNLSTAGAHQVTYGGGPKDGILAKFAPCTTPTVHFANSGYICDSSNFVFELYFNGSAPWTITYSLDGIEQAPLTTTSATYFPTVTLPWSDSIKLLSVYSGTCTGQITGAFDYVKIPSPVTASVPVITCDMTSQSYTVSFTLDGGAFGTYLSGGPTTGFINGSVFTSQAIPFLTDYDISVFEASRCDTLHFSGTSGCTVPCPPTFGTINNNSPLCEGGSLQLDSDGGISYQWAGPNGYTSSQSAPVIQNIQLSDAGNYTVTITDANQCTSVLTTTVVILDGPNLVVSSNSPVCSGNTINLSASGGTSYLWSGPVGFTSSIQNPIIGQAGSGQAGTYAVTVTGANGCTSSGTTQVQVLVNPTVNASSNSPLCSGNTINLSASGGTSYLWSGPGEFNSSVQNPMIGQAGAGQAGVYVVTVTGTNGCTSSGTTNVQVLVNPTVNASSNNPVCSGNAINLSASGGTSYLWTGPGGFSSNIQNPMIGQASAGQAGSYIVTVTGANGCTSSASTIVQVVANPVVNSSSNNPVCSNETLKLSASGGVNYVWSGPGGFSSSIPNPMIGQVSTNNSGDYGVTVTSSEGCSTSAVVQVVVRPPIAAEIDHTGEVCEGDDIVLLASGGTNYAWSGPNGYSGVQALVRLQNSVLAQGGTYSLTVTDVYGCLDTLTTRVTVHSKPIALINGQDTLCKGSSATLSTSNTGNLIWNTGASTSSVVVSPEADTTYSLIVSENGCTDTVTFLIRVINPPVIQLHGDTTIETGSSLALIAVGASTYQWSPSDDLSCSTCPNPLAMPKTTTTYCVTGSQLGCISERCVTITVRNTCIVHVPNVFTPNGDGFNDTWCSQKHDCVVQQKLSIYDRWGNLVKSQSDEMVCWDGSFNGAVAPSGVYTYLIQLDYEAEKSSYISGTILLAQ